MTVEPFLVVCCNLGQGLVTGHRLLLAHRELRATTRLKATWWQEKMLRFYLKSLFESLKMKDGAFMNLSCYVNIEMAYDT